MVARFIWLAFGLLFFLSSQMNCFDLPHMDIRPWSKLNKTAQRQVLDIQNYMEEILFENNFIYLNHTKELIRAKGEKMITMGCLAQFLQVLDDMGNGELSAFHSKLLKTVTFSLLNSL